MQAVVKMPRIEINFKNVSLSEVSDNETVNIFGTDWYRDIKSRITPGDNLQIYRENHEMTQAKLGEILGGVHSQHISDMECGTKSISVETAQKLAKIFKVSPDKFFRQSED